MFHFPGTPNDPRDLMYSLTEDGAMGHLDRMIGAAHQIEGPPEDFESYAQSMDLVRALATDDGYDYDSD